MKNKLAAFAALSMAFSVALGALGAHFLKQKVELGIITESNLNSFETAIKYQIYHSIALLILATTCYHKISKWPIIAMISGMLLFSCSIYLLSTKGLTGLNTIGFLGPITPIGGLLLIAAWIGIAFNLLKSKN
jgi:uncharacterized membrane protein YgdD (TMEM256/DUF423 family)